MKTRAIAILLALAGISLAGCTSTTIKTANGTTISRTSVGTNTQLASLKVDLKADGSGSGSIEGLASDQTTATNALIVALAKALANSSQVAAPAK